MNFLPQVEPEMRRKIDIITYWTSVTLGCIFVIPISTTFLILAAVSFNSCPGIALYMICLESNIIIFRIIIPLLISPLAYIYPRYSRYFTTALTWILTLLSTGFHIWGLVAINNSVKCNYGSPWSRYNFIAAVVFVSVGFFCFFVQIGFTCVIVLTAPKKREIIEF
jgi:hypothetical protein